METRPWRTITVIAFACFLVVQGFFSFVIEPEPYPSVRMPDFGWASASDETFHTPIRSAEVVTENGVVTAIAPMSLMADFPFDMAKPSYDYMFLKSDSREIAPSVKAWLSTRLSDLELGSRPVELRLCWQEATFSVVDASIVSRTPCTWRMIEL